MSHSPRAQLQEAVKPMLRGYSHAITAPLALLATVVLAVMAAGDTARQVTVLIYGATMVLLFSGSALYHVGNWSQRTREVLQRLDHSNIFLLIAGTYTPIAFVVLAGWQRAAVLGAVWGLSLVGVAISYAIGQASPMIAALWGVFVWREFRGSNLAARFYLAGMFVAYVLALVLIARADQVG